MKLAFLKDRYDFELDRREKLTAALTLPAGVLTALGGLMGIMARSFSYRDPTLTGFFLTFLVAAVVAFTICLVCLARAYDRQTYVHLPLLRDLEQADEEFREFNNYVESTGGEVEEDFADHLRKRIIQAADANTLSNDIRSAHMHHARIWLFAVLVFTALAGIPYVADQVRNIMPTQQAPKPTQPPPQASTPQKPQFPENRVVKEGQTPKR